MYSSLRTTKNFITNLVGAICYTYTTGSSALPDIYAQTRSPRATGPQACVYISGKAQVPVV